MSTDKLKTKRRFAVIFDMDGVIVNSKNAHYFALKAICDKYNWEFSERIFKELVFGTPNSVWLPKIAKQEFSPSEIQRLSEEKEQIFRTEYNSRLEIVPGITEFLGSLCKYNIPFTIASSAPRKNVFFILNKFNLDNFFPDKEIILHESNILSKYAKPNAGMYLKAAENVKTPPENCIVFEDSKVGIQAANNSKCIVIALTTTYTKRELLNFNLEIDAYYSDFNEINVGTIKEILRKRDS